MDLVTRANRAGQQQLIFYLLLNRSFHIEYALSLVQDVWIRERCQTANTSLNIKMQ